ncbi:hypothetical protein TWF481_011009 [Arthrobotrys musiformis]|uniref:Uncharacterized protein n=1 Tax=Arthrobotrys musiformis TaxID=47236 RepID=A0AAV9VZ00_9PEZI
MTNISQSSKDSVVTVVPLTQEQLHQTPAEMYRQKQMALMEQETESRLAPIRQAIAENYKKYATPRRVKRDKMIRDAKKRREMEARQKMEKKKAAAMKAQEQSTTRRLLTPPPKRKTPPRSPNEPITPRRVRPGMTKAEIDQAMSDNEDWSDLIATSPSPAPRNKSGSSMRTEPQLRPLNPVRPYLRLSGPVKSRTEEFEEAQDPTKAKNKGLFSVLKVPKVQDFERDGLLLPVKAPPPPKPTDNSEASSSSAPAKPAPPLPPRPIYKCDTLGRLPISVIREYKALLGTRCPPAWRMLDMYFAQLSRPDAHVNRDELIAQVFWNWERLSGLRIANLPEDKILRTVMDYVSSVLQRKC